MRGYLGNNGQSINSLGGCEGLIGAATSRRLSNRSYPTSDTSRDGDLSEDTGNGQQGDLLPSQLSWPPFRDF